jgi:hypothetical protein
LIEVEANSKDDLEKYEKTFVDYFCFNCLKFRWLEWIEKARKPFEKNKPFSSSTSDKTSSSSTLR